MEQANSYKVIDTMDMQHTQIIVRDDGIIQFMYGDIQYTMKETLELEAAVIKICKGVVYKSLRVATKYSGIDMDVMRYLSKGKGALLTLADAFVIDSVSQKTLANLYLKINKPYVPTSAFYKLANAEAWLKSLDDKELQEIHQMNLKRIY